MHDLEALLYRLQNSGLSEPQAKQSMQLIQQYVAEKYPVMGMLLHGWFKQNFNDLSHPAKTSQKQITPSPPLEVTGSFDSLAYSLILVSVV